MLVLLSFKFLSLYELYRQRLRDGDDNLRRPPNSEDELPHDATPQPSGESDSSPSSPFDSQLVTPANRQVRPSILLCFLIY